MNKYIDEIEVKGVTYNIADAHARELIGSKLGINILTVETLPTENIDSHTIYLLPIEGDEIDSYDEYMYINSKWEKIGDTIINWDAKSVNGIRFEII